MDLDLPYTFMEDRFAECLVEGMFSTPIIFSSLPRSREAARRDRVSQISVQREPDSSLRSLS
jgi:hypothetical protein